MNLFPLQERMMDFVPRWTIVPRIREQSIANHMYFVALYAGRLCHYLKPVPSPEFKCSVYEYSLVHDMEELLTSDIPGPTKKRIVSEEAIDGLMREHLAENPGRFIGQMLAASDEVKAVVKTADLIDALYWTAIEVRLGNTLIGHRMYTQVQRLRDQLHKLPIDEKVFASISDEITRRDMPLPEYRNYETSKG